jgi:hypothetical protein
MKITKAQLKRIIKEEMNTTFKEWTGQRLPWDPRGGQGAGATAKGPGRPAYKQREEEDEEDDELADYFATLRSRAELDEALTENIENLTVENMLVAIDALSQMAVTIGIPIAVATMVFNKLKKHVESKIASKSDQ